MKKIILLFTILHLKLSSQTWVQLTDFPGTERDDASSFVINNKAYCITGLDVSFSCTGNGYILDGATETWTTMASLPTSKERQYATAFSHNAKGYLLGGINCSSVCLNDFWQYDPGTDSWTALPNFPGVARQGMCNFIIKNKVYIAGGKLADGTTVLKDVWEYDFTTTTWTQKNNLPVNGMWRGAGFAIDTIGYICYGMNNNQAFNRYMYRYNYVTDTWSKIPGLTLSDKKYIGTTVINNQGYLYGGQDSLGNITNNLMLFDPATNILLTRGGIPTFGRKGGMAFALNNTYYFTTGVTNTARVKETWKATGSVGIKELTDSKTMIVYPNPVSSTLHISIQNFKNTEATLEIINPSGESIHSSSYTEQIDVSSFSRGIYFILVRNKTHPVYKAKFIKE